MNITITQYAESNNSNFLVRISQTVLQMSGIFLPFFAQQTTRWPWERGLLRSNIGLVHMDLIERADKQQTGWSHPLNRAGSVWCVLLLLFCCTVCWILLSWDIINLHVNVMTLHCCINGEINIQRGLFTTAVATLKCYHNPEGIR